MLNHVKPKNMAYQLCQITLHWKLLYKFKKWCKFPSRVRAKSRKKKSHKKRQACITLQTPQSALYQAVQSACE